MADNERILAEIEVRIDNARAELTDLYPYLALVNTSGTSNSMRKMKGLISDKFLSSYIAIY